MATSVCVLRVDGMTCNSCAGIIKNHLELMEGVIKADVEVDAKRVTVLYSHPLQKKDIKLSMGEIGYQAIDYERNWVPGEIGYQADLKSPQPKRERKTRVLESKNEQYAAVTLTIAGITCASCVTTLENHLENQSGVVTCDVNFVRETAVVQYDPSVIGVKGIIEHVDDVGFKAVELIAKVKDVYLELRGMTCASCVATVEGHLRALPYVVEVTVNLLKEEALVKYDAETGSLTGIVAAVDEVGFEAVPRRSAKSTEDVNQGHADQTRFYKRVLVISLIFAVPAFVVAMILPFFPDLKDKLMVRVLQDLPLMDLLLWILVTPVQFGVGAIFMKSAYKSLRHGYANMYVLITIGTLAAYLYALISVVDALSRRPNEQKDMNDGVSNAHFFETSSTLITLVVVGKLMETVTKGKTSQALTELMSLQAPVATRVRLDDTGAVENEEEIETELLVVNDLVKVVRGGRVPTDGVIVRGNSNIDESMITGESIPVQKTVGDAVIGSTVNEDGMLIVKVTKMGDESMLANIVRLMEDAQASKAPIQAFADKLSTVFVPVVIFIAIGSFVVWFALASTDSLPTEWQEESGEGDFLFSFLFGIATLVIACPCALGLATPTAVMVGTGVGARYGVLIKGGEPLQAANGVNAFVFDKTGTLTEGKPVVTNVKVIDTEIPVDDIIFLAGCAELHSEHVLGKAIQTFAKEHADSDRDLQEPTDFEAVSGRGLRCTVDDHYIVIGNRQWIMDNEVDISALCGQVMTQFEARGRIALLVSVDGKVRAVYSLLDIPRPEAKAVIERLTDMGVEVWMCTGDNKTTAEAIAGRLGIVNVMAETLPVGKFELIEYLQKQDKTVAMIGDGINDSPALAQADLSFSVGAGTDVAMEAASIILVTNNLWGIVTALDLSQVTFRRIRWNFVWAMGYNVIGIPVAAGLFYPLFRERLPPQLAALAMAFSSVSVILSSLLLKRYKAPTRDERVANKNASQERKYSADDVEMMEPSLSKVSQGNSSATEDNCCGCNTCECCSALLTNDHAIDVVSSCECRCRTGSTCSTYHKVKIEEKSFNSFREDR